MAEPIDLTGYLVPGQDITKLEIEPSNNRVTVKPAELLDLLAAEVRKPPIEPGNAEMAQILTMTAIAIRTKQAVDIHSAILDWAIAVTGVHVCPDSGADVAPATERATALDDYNWAAAARFAADHPATVEEQ